MASHAPTGIAYHPNCQFMAQVSAGHEVLGAKTGVALAVARALIGLGIIGESQLGPARVVREEAVASGQMGRSVGGQTLRHSSSRTPVVPTAAGANGAEPWAASPMH